MRVLESQAPLIQDTLIDDLNSIEKSERDTTTKRALVNARIGQGKFRDDVLRVWGHCCAVTGSATKDAIRASHIKPWKESTDDERLDPHNGLALVATLDALFDKGLITFQSSGRMLVSSQLSKAERRILDIENCSLAVTPSASTGKYLAHHRDGCFKK